MKQSTRSAYEAAVLRAVRSIAEGLDEALDLEALGKQAALSPLHFHRVFRGLVGETARELHRRLRLERAARMLVTTDVSVTRVAFEAGYETHESFTRAFHGAFFASPSAFRERHRERSARAASALRLASPSGVHYGMPFDAELDLQHALERSKSMNVSIHEFPARTIFFVRHIGPYASIGDAFSKLHAIAGESGLLTLPALAMVALYHDDPEATPPDELRSDAALVVPSGTKLPPGLEQSTIPAGTYASTIHVGPYAGLGDAWARFMGGWLSSSGRRLGDGPAYERYINTPMTASEHELQTELAISLA
ncbi:MAG: AraC family transcriptional regulator [Myxococcales bacterium]|nr:AraC family transcriptional regulator [Myxococcales bacterium]